MTSAARHRRLRLAWIISGVISTVLVAAIRLAWPATSWLFAGPAWAFPAIAVAYHHGWLRRDRERQSTSADVPGGLLTYSGPVDEATMARLREAFKAEVRRGQPPQVLP